MHVTDTIDALLLEGRVPADPAAFKEHIRSCVDCRTRLDEGLVLNEALDSLSRRNHLSGEEWDTLVAASLGQNGPLMGDHEWNALVQKTVNKKPGMGKFLSFPFSGSFYALAAGLLLMIGAFLFFQQKDSLKGKSIAQTTSIQPISDSLIILTPKSKAVLSKGTQLRVLKDFSDEAAVIVDKGSALFQVTPHVYKTYRVTTGDAEITVTGTVFDVRIIEGKTFVSVIEGSVHVLYKALRQECRLSRNEKCQVVDGTASVTSMQPADAALLRPFIHALGEAAPVIRQAPTPVATKTDSPSPTSDNPMPPVRDMNKVLEDAIQLSARSDYAAALALFDDILESPFRGGPHETAFFKSALLLTGPLKRTEDGLRRLKDYLTQFPSGVYVEESLIELVRIFRLQRDFENILTYETLYLGRFKNGALAVDYYYETATFLREKKDYHAAQEHYRMFIQTAPTDRRAEDAYFWLGKCLMNAGMASEADAVYRQYTEKYPEGRWLEEIRKVAP